MSNDLIIPSENDKTTVLNQIDALHEEHRLKILRGLAVEHNDSLSGMGHYDRNIDLEKYGNTVFDLIFSLWMRGVKVPAGLAFGDLYDSELSSCAGSISPNDYSVEKSRAVMLLHNPQLVRFYLVAGVNPRRGSEYQMGKINECIQQLRQKDGSRWERVSNRDQLRVFLLDPELNEFDLALLAIMFEDRNIYYDNFTIGDIYYFLEGNPV